MSAVPRSQTTMYRKYIVRFWGLTGVLLVAGFFLEKDHVKFIYDLVIAGAGFAAAIAAAVTIVDRIMKGREQEEWSFVRRMALRQVRSALRSLALSFAICFIDACGEVSEYLKDDADTAKKYTEFAKALNFRPKWAEDLKSGDGDKLVRARGDYDPVVKDLCGMQFDRLVQSQCERRIIGALMAFDDSWRAFDRMLTSWGQISAEEKLKLDIGWALHVSRILTKMATIDDLSRTALQRLESGALNQKV
jgi:hypothetical protein